MSKYDCITVWLNKHTPETVEIRIDALEEVIGFPFPASCRKYPWMNDRTQGLGKSFLLAGYKVSQPYPDKNVLRFTYNPEGAQRLLGGNVERKRSTNQYVRKHRTIAPRADVPSPSIAEVEKYLAKWETLDNYSAQERALDKLFFEVYPCNADMNEVLIKVSCLNDFYYTNIYSTYSVAKRILSLDIDARLKAGDPTLVDDIAVVTMDNGNVKNFYSFATKYCSHHKPTEYAIYDSYVEDVLKYYRDVDDFCDFFTEDLRSYEKFVAVLRAFAKFYNLEQYTLKDLDKYLWLLGKDKFPQKRYQAKEK